MTQESGKSKNQAAQDGTVSVTQAETSVARSNAYHKKSLAANWAALAAFNSSSADKANQHQKWSVLVLVLQNDRKMNLQGTHHITTLSGNLPHCQTPMPTPSSNPKYNPGPNPTPDPDPDPDCNACTRSSFTKAPVSMRVKLRDKGRARVWHECQGSGDMYRNVDSVSSI